MKKIKSIKNIKLILYMFGLLIIARPITGFFIIILYKAIAEIIRIIVSIANNCRDIAKK